MTKNSLRNQKKERMAAAQEEKAQQGQTKSQPTVKPVQVGEQKGKGVPKARKTNAAKAAQEAASKPTAKKAAPKVEPKTSGQAECGMPEWMEKYFKYQAGLTMQLGDQIVQDHRVLTDHEWRIHELEEWRTAVDERCTDMVLDLTELPDEDQPIPLDEVPQVEIPPVELEPETEQPEVVEPMAEAESVNAPDQSETEPTEDPSIPEGAIPREMYMAKTFKGGKWRWCGPYQRLSQAEQAAHGDLSKTKIINVWYDPEQDAVLGYMSAEDMECYL